MTVRRHAILWREHFLRSLSLVCGVVLLTSLSFLLGLYSALAQNTAYETVIEGWQGMQALFESDSQLDEFLQPARRPGEGVTVNRIGEEDHLVLLAGFFDGGNEIRLIRRDGSIVNRWPLSYTALFPEVSVRDGFPVSDLHVDTHGALIESDGAIVFNLEYVGLVKLDRCGEVLWTLAHQTHHSVEHAQGGGYWVPGRATHSEMDPEAFPPFTGGYARGAYKEDLILKVSDEGRILERISVPRLLYDDGLQSVMTAIGTPYPRVWGGEFVHLNDIEELSEEMASAFPRFETGDLLLSLRNYNLVLIIDPETREVLWHRTGPWQRQHDPDFAPDGTITVFDNNRFEENASRIIRLDLTSGEYWSAWGGEPDQALWTTIRGKHQATAAGGFLVTEFDGGRVLETSGNGEIVWEYVNRFDAERVGEISSARLVHESDLDVASWSCPER